MLRVYEAKGTVRDVDFTPLLFINNWAAKVAQYRQIERQDDV